jgi:hypothetical protein
MLQGLVALRDGCAHLKLIVHLPHYIEKVGVSIPVGQPHTDVSEGSRLNFFVDYAVHHVDTWLYLRELEWDVNLHEQWLVGSGKRQWDSEVFTSSSRACELGPEEGAHLGDLTDAAY